MRSALAPWVGRALGVGIGLALVLPVPATPATPTHWSDAATGLVIGGHDPLVYFTRKMPLRGREEHELVWRGGVWRFSNAGNMAAFAKHPEVYAPRFAGYDPTSIANGRPARGHPAVWAIHDGRLYLFHDSVSRRLWSLDPGAVIARARANWPKLGRLLPDNSDR